MGSGHGEHEEKGVEVLPELGGFEVQPGVEVVIAFELGKGRELLEVPGTGAERIPWIDLVPEPADVMERLLGCLGAVPEPGGL